jgi:ABC-type transporter Mla subunit MlaD
MSQVRDKRQNNVKAGIFVLVSIIIGLVVFSVLTNAWGRIFSTTSTYHAVFEIRQGIGALSAGSKVKLGGVLVGNVSSVKPRAESDEPVSLIDVIFKFDNQFALYDNASIHARAGLLGTSGWLEVSDVGSGSKANSKTELVGTTETMVTQLLGSDAEINISKSLGALRKLSEALVDDSGALNLLLGSNDAIAIKEAINSAKSSLATLDSIMKKTGLVFPEWKAMITTILSDSKNIPNQINETLEKIRLIVSDVQADVLPNIRKSMESLTNSMDSLELMSKTYQTYSPEWAAKITKIVGNVDQISSRAKAAIDDISASPWRLLYRPTNKEIAYEQLNAASWQLLTALSDLRVSAEALESASLSEDAPSEAATLSVTLLESAVAFKKAREAIMQRMKLDFPNH